MKILYGTTNPAKLLNMKNWLSGLDIELLSLIDMDAELPCVYEAGDTPLENAVIKAKAYYDAFKMPVFSCDSGLYFENLPELSPLVHVRNVGGKSLTDDEMIEYYGTLAKKHGDIIARYKNAICFVKDDSHIYTDTADDLCGKAFIITSVPHKKREKGFPLDSLSKRIDSGEYYYDSEKTDSDNAVNGFYRFFKEILQPDGCI